VSPQGQAGGWFVDTTGGAAAEVSGEVLVVLRPADGSAVLAFPDDVEDGPASRRSKACCRVLGWAAGGELLYESRGPQQRVLAWRVGTDDVRLVTTIDLDQEAASATWLSAPDLSAG
jgi:hypothetical protein